MSSSPHPPIVDIHTHVYPPAYVKLLKSRSTVPYIRSFADDPTLRLVILPGEDDASTPSTSRGRPIGPEYFDIAEKISFMDQHSIDISVISLANPWLDFLPAAASPAAAIVINNDINAICATHPGRLYAFATLPVTAGAEACVAEIKRVKGLEWVRGVVLGTGGMGDGLDDDRMEGVWVALAESGLTTFLHPHYGLPAGVYGPKAGEYGHVLPLAMGFPMETTIAVARMLLSQVFDRHPTLTLLLAHSGGTLPFLAGRLESCILHDAHLRDHDMLPRRDIWDVLKENILLDAVVYSKLGLQGAVEASGADRVLFGTDHPFFPPLGGIGAGYEPKWLSVTTNYSAIDATFFTERDKAVAVLGGNALRLLRLVPGV